MERPCVIRVWIKESKTDRIRKEATVTLCWTGGCMCPVKVALAFMVVVRDHAEQEEEKVADVL